MRNKAVVDDSPVSVMTGIPISPVSSRKCLLSWLPYFFRSHHN